MDADVINAISFIRSSKRRTDVFMAIGKGMTMPSEIAKSTSMRVNHVSANLSDLKDHGLVICLNEDATKGRLYSLTDFGERIKDMLGV